MPQLAYFNDGIEFYAINQERSSVPLWELAKLECPRIMKTLEARVSHQARYTCTGENEIGLNSIPGKSRKRIYGIVKTFTSNIVINFWRIGVFKINRPSRFRNAEHPCGNYGSLSRPRGSLVFKGKVFRFRTPVEPRRTGKLKPWSRWVGQRVGVLESCGPGKNEGL
jgi:hypothetical protein